MKAILFALVFTATQFALADAGSKQILSSKVSVNPARITSREVLVNKSGNNGLLVQVIAEHTNGATDVSNTHKIILTVSQIGEMTEKEVSFVIGSSMGLTRVERVSGGIYRVIYNDASEMDNGRLSVIKTIDARNAVSEVQKSDCGDFDICVVKSAVTVTTSYKE